MRRGALLLAGLVCVCVIALASPAFGASAQNPVPPGFTRERIVDYVRGGGSPFPATDAATDFKVQLHPFVLKLDHSLAYTIDTTGCSGQCTNAAAVLAGTSGLTGSGLAAWGVSGLTLTHNEASPNTNPCTANPDSVTWAPIGSATVLAETFPCLDNTTGTIVGFDIVYNSNATWSDCTSTTSCANGTSGSVAIAATAAHEGGHVYGLQHDHAAKDVRLTMYFAIGANDYGLATLGCGDRRGVNALYETTLDCTNLPGD
jgi:hypothetical protein